MAVLVILGFGGHARSVADVALAVGYRALFFVDGNARAGETFANFPVYDHMPEPLPADGSLFPAAGDNAARQAQMDSHQGPFATLVSPRAYTGVAATLGSAVLIAHHAHVGPASSIGDGAIINTGAIVDHDCQVGRFAHVSVNATVAGRCVIGVRAFLGAGCVVKDGIVVGDDVVVGAGAVVVHDLTVAGAYVGAPARRIDG